MEWKRQVQQGEIAILTHYWQDKRFPGCTTVTKVGCKDINKLKAWGKRYNLKADWIHYSDYPHFDLFGDRQKEILFQEQADGQVKRFGL